MLYALFTADPELRVDFRAYALRSRTTCGSDASRTVAGGIRTNRADGLVDDLRGDTAGEGATAGALLSTPAGGSKIKASSPDEAFGGEV